MLSFVLAITTYLFFQQRTDAVQKGDAAAAAREAAEREKRTQELDNERLRAVIGMAKDSADTIEAERNQLFENQFAKYEGEEKTFVKLVEWLDAANRKLLADMQNLNQEKAALEDDMKKRFDQAVTDRQLAEKQVATVRDDLTKVEAEYKQDRDDAQTTMADIKKKQEEAGERAEQLKAIVEGVADLGKFLTNYEMFRYSKGRRYESRDRGKKFEAEASDTEKLKKVAEELEFAHATIQQLTATLNQLRVADPALQRVVREQGRKDDRIDGFDGRIVEVNELDRTVLVSTPSTVGIRPGLAFSVFDPSDPRPAEADRKGLIEVVQVEGPGLARAHLRSDITDQPILPGDGIATSLWSPGVEVEVVVVGYVDFRGSPDDAAALKQLIERSGARISQHVTTQTSLLVDAGTPRADTLARGRLKEWDKSAQDLQKNEVKMAGELGIPTVGLDRLFEMLGLDPVALRGNRLPRAESTGTPGTF